MFNVISKKFILSVVLGALLLPTLALAVTPTAYLEQSQVIATGKKISAYRVPTKDVDGKIKYYDLTATFNVLDSGQIDTTTSTIVSKVSPNFSANKFIPGTYKTADGEISCTLTATVLSGGRQQGALACQVGTTAYELSASWVSGAIAGHPFGLDLLAAGIDKITGYQDFSWGKIGKAHGSAYFECMEDGEIISATQVGSSINISGYDSGNIQKCGQTFVKQ